MENLSQQGFMAALREFGTKLKNTDATGLFYYAGHGMQVKGANYLIPVDAAIESEDEVRYLSIDANHVLDKMEQAGNREYRDPGRVSGQPGARSRPPSPAHVQAE